MGYANNLLDCDLCTPTANQEMQTQYKIQINKNRVPTTDGYDWYLVSATLNHSVNGYGGVDNWLSQGIFGNSLFLQIKDTSAHHWRLWPHLQRQQQHHVLQRPSHHRLRQLCQLRLVAGH